MSTSPWSLRDSVRILRIAAKKALGIEPAVPIVPGHRLEFHGTPGNGWCILADSLTPSSVVVDVGLGEDIGFSRSVSSHYGCEVHGFDPTPRALAYVARVAPPRFSVHPIGLGAAAGRVPFYLPNNPDHVSGAITREDHVGGGEIEVELVTLGGLMQLLGTHCIDLLKLDIEGAEYDVLASDDFRRHASAIGQICVEFHHRWKGRGRASTDAAVRTLAGAGFECAWISPTTNEEYLFVRRNVVADVSSGRAR